MITAEILRIVNKESMNDFYAFVLDCHGKYPVYFTELLIWTMSSEQRVECVAYLDTLTQNGRWYNGDQAEHEFQTFINLFGLPDNTLTIN